MAVTEKQKMNLRPFTSENANERRIKGLKTRASNSQLNKLIDANYGAILNILAKNSGKEFADILEQWEDMPLLLRIYLEDINDRDKRRRVIEEIVDRVKGRPRQSVEAQVEGGGSFVIKVGSKDQGSDIEKAME